MEITKAQLELEERKEGKDLYSYQKGAIDKIFTAFEESPEDYHLLLLLSYLLSNQLPYLD